MLEHGRQRQLGQQLQPLGLVFGRIAQMSEVLERTAQAARARHTTRGRHVLADLDGIAPALLADAARLESVLVAAAVAAGAQVLGAHFHRFDDGSPAHDGPAGNGVTGVVMLSESHISIHTWPEVGYAALDVFMCGAADPRIALAHVREALAPADARVTLVERG